MNNLGPLARKFAWAGGIEDTFIPQERPGLRALEEYELMQHYGQWREDLERAAQTGVKFLRWGVPWYKVEPEMGCFDWSFTDQVLPYMVKTLGITPITDLVHYGTPSWLSGSFVDTNYPDCVAAYAKAFAQRYQELIRYYTPLNEPTVNAEFSGRRGEWPPYLKGDQGYVAMLLSISSGIQKTVKAIESVDKDAVFVAVEAMHFARALSPLARSAAKDVFYQDLLCYDLVRGAVNSSHRLFSWLTANGADPALLSILEKGAVQQHILGVNFYPWSGNSLDVDSNGKVVEVSNRASGRDLLYVLRLVHKYSQAPLMVTETSSPGSIPERIAWMRETIAAVAQARSENICVLGYTWFPLFSMIGWEYRTSQLPVDKHLLHLGIWDCEFDQSGVPVRKETPLRQLYSRFIRRGSPRCTRSRAG